MPSKFQFVKRAGSVGCPGSAGPFRCGRLLSGMSSYWKLSHSPFYVREFTRIGWPDSRLPLLACLQLGAIILFLIPPTAVLGCIILTGYLGGAVAAYTRMGEPYPILVPLSTAMIAWFGIWLRDERLRRLLPVR